MLYCFLFIYILYSSLISLIQVDGLDSYCLDIIHFLSQSRKKNAFTQTKNPVGPGIFMFKDTESFIRNLFLPECNLFSILSIKNLDYLIFIKKNHLFCISQQSKAFIKNATLEKIYFKHVALSQLKCLKSKYYGEHGCLLIGLNKMVTGNGNTQFNQAW